MVRADFWLVEAPDSLERQSARNADGFGIGAFGIDGAATVDKGVLPAYEDPGFVREAHELIGTTFVAHVRHATTGAVAATNSHPFTQDDRLFAHNGALGDLPRLEARLQDLDAMGLVHGDTDSERFFALITALIRAHDGHVEAGITEAVAWVVAHLTVVSLNFVLATATDLWAFRHPALDTLFVLERPAGGTGAQDAEAGRTVPGDGLDARGSHLAVRSAPLDSTPSVVVASERMDDEDGWRAVEPGHLIHVDRRLHVATTSILP
ncbi:class II glutamine amidotransferase [Frondihabitans sp. PAMC 28766]|uniref:class II glutamine amidotransferase n=1 Tax=Frondihabitans sp. PAMC 28766 TaxID=1795630 RepID=UPI0012FFA283|nr:class II glutamine amidotransferase [Frondihabitans sp. PAMC 28766]